MEIRLANMSDVQTVSLLNADVQRVHATALPNLFKLPSEESFPASTVAKLLADPKNYFFIGRVDDKDVGYVYAELIEWAETGSRYAMRMMYVHHISLRPEYQHRGLGKLLMEAVKGLAREKSVSLIALDVWSFNAKARAFFESQGLQDYNVRMWMDVGE